MTANGPNRFSSEYSGHFVANYSRQEPVYDLTVYPYFVTVPSAVKENIHPYLRRDDGSVFVVMLRAGRSIYQERVLDPFYAAHEMGMPAVYYPDHEATALGCVEQFRLCLNPVDSFCTDWGSDFDSLIQVILAPQNISLVGPQRLDVAFIYPYFTMMASMHYYFHIRTGARVLLTSVLRETNLVPFINQNEQWVLEVQAWFATAFLNGKYSLLQIVRRSGAKRTGNEVKSMLKMCHLITFQNNNYANIDFIGFTVSLSVILLMWPLSTPPFLKLYGWLVGKIEKAYEQRKCAPDMIRSYLNKIRNAESIKASRGRLGDALKSLGDLFKRLSTFSEPLGKVFATKHLPGLATFSSLTFTRQRPSERGPSDAETTAREVNEREAGERESSRRSRRPPWIRLGTWNRTSR